MDRKSFFNTEKPDHHSSIKQFDEKMETYWKLDVANSNSERDYRGRSPSFGSSEQSGKSLIPKPTKPRTKTVSESEDVMKLRSQLSRSRESLAKSPLPKRNENFTRGGMSHSTLPRDFIKTEGKDAGRKSPIDGNISQPASKGTFTHAGNSDAEYKMNHFRRGTAIIFNHEKFKGEDWPSREGTEKDVKNLKSTLLKLGFKDDDIKVFNDLTYAGIDRELDKLRLQDHSTSDCFMMFVLTHGCKDDRILARDIDYSVKHLWEPFTAEKCSSLAGKPKIFFIIACRGDNMDGGFRMINRQLRKFSLTTERDAAPMGPVAAYTIPIWADFLTIYSTVQGYFSYRDKFNGTWYIQALCEEISQADLDSSHFMDVLTKVNRRVAINFQTYNPDEPMAHKKKQCPYIASTLTRFIYMGTKT